VTTPLVAGFRASTLRSAKSLSCNANFRPNPKSADIPTRYPDVDLIIVRENTESLYSGWSMRSFPALSRAEDHYRKSSTRIAKFAFEYARKNQRKEDSRHSQSNIMKLPDGLIPALLPHRGQGLPEIAYGEHS